MIESFHVAASTSSRTEPNSSLVKASGGLSAGIESGGSNKRLTAFSRLGLREVSTATLKICLVKTKLCRVPRLYCVNTELVRSYTLGNCTSVLSCTADATGDSSLEARTASVITASLSDSTTVSSISSSRSVSRGRSYRRR